jgi:hypothetical protein
VGLTSDSESPKGSPIPVVGTFLLLLICTAALPAAASVYQLDYSSNTGTLTNPSVTLAGGTTGTSAISSVSPDGATASVVAGIEFYGDAAGAACTTPTVTTSLSPPSPPSSFRIARNSFACWWSPQYTVSSSIFALTWTTDLWLDSSNTGNTLSLAMYATDSTGAITGTFFTGVTSTVPTAETEIKNTFAGTAAAVPANGYIEFKMTAVAGGARHFDVYWGTGQLSNFQSPSTYSDLLAINDGVPVAWNVNLATQTLQTSNLGRLTTTISFVSPASNQIIISGGTISQATGSAVALAASGTIDLEVVATASAIPTATNIPSMVTFSIIVASTTSTAFAQYTVVLNID